MSGLQDLTATREALRTLVKVVKSTRQALGAMIQETDQPGRLRLSSRPGQFAPTLEHIEAMREGFILSQRTPDTVSLAELRILIQHVLLDWAWLGELDLAFAPGERIEPVDQQLLTYHHALVTLGMVPRLPAEAVTFPQSRPTYADVSVPALPNELLARIEEIEQVIYQAEVMPKPALAYDPFRRTYAFFEASTWLVNKYLEPLLRS